MRLGYAIAGLYFPGSRAKMRSFVAKALLVAIGAVLIVIPYFFRE
ncbi:MAG TPA: hypothetical protein VK523_09980 [Steroidobacteraceae bacterium]|nr:hypothetical protein [Steroidobacteraceae bacterium]